LLPGCILSMDRFEAFIRWYRREHKPRIDRESQWFARQPSLADAIRLAAPPAAGDSSSIAVGSSRGARSGNVSQTRPGLNAPPDHRSTAEFHNPVSPVLPVTGRSTARVVCRPGAACAPPGRQQSTPFRRVRKPLWPSGSPSDCKPSVRNRISLWGTSVADHHPCNRRFSSSPDEVPTHTPACVRL
jgi:hypothetical protein